MGDLKAQWWAKIFPSLQQMLREAAREALPDTHEKNKYFISVTHEEVEKGIIANHNRDAQVLCVLRKISDLERSTLPIQAFHEQV